MRISWLKGGAMALAAALVLAGISGTSLAKKNNPPGPKGGPGTNWDNPPGPAGGPGSSPGVKPAAPPPGVGAEKHRAFCLDHPADASCQGWLPPKEHGYCKYHPADPACHQRHGKFCRKHPSHPKCQAAAAPDNPPGPAGGPGAGPLPPKDVDNNPPGATGGPGTNWENPPGPAGGAGASPDLKPKK